MKQSVVTGDYIYNQIKKLNEDMRELTQALDGLERGTLPHNLLSKSQEEKIRELQAARSAEYTA